MNWVANAAY